MQAFRWAALPVAIFIEIDECFIEIDVFCSEYDELNTNVKETDGNLVSALYNTDDTADTADAVDPGLPNNHIVAAYFSLNGCFLPIFHQQQVQFEVFCLKIVLI